MAKTPETIEQMKVRIETRKDDLELEFVKCQRALELIDELSKIKFVSVK